MSGRRIGVAVATNTLCEPKFEKGKNYLVYATFQNETKQFFTGMCTGTGEYGDFSISPPGPGSFTVRVSVPYAARLVRYSYDIDLKRTQTETASTFEYDVTLEKNACNYLELEIERRKQVLTSNAEVDSSTRHKRSWCREIQ